MNSGVRTPIVPRPTYLAQRVTRNSISHFSTLHSFKPRHPNNKNNWEVNLKYEEKLKHQSGSSEPSLSLSDTQTPEQFFRGFLSKQEKKIIKKEEKDTQRAIMKYQQQKSNESSMTATERQTNKPLYLTDSRVKYEPQSKKNCELKNIAIQKAKEAVMKEREKCLSDNRNTKSNACKIQQQSNKCQNVLNNLEKQKRVHQKDIFQSDELHQELKENHYESNKSKQEANMPNNQPGDDNKSHSYNSEQISDNQLDKRLRQIDQRIKQCQKEKNRLRHLKKIDLPSDGQGNQMKQCPCCRKIISKLCFHCEHKYCRVEDCPRKKKQMLNHRMLVKMRINKKYHEDEENIEGKTEVQKSKKKGVQPRRESYLSEESDFTEEEDQKNFSLLDQSEKEEEEAVEEQQVKFEVRRPRTRQTKRITTNHKVYELKKLTNKEIYESD